MTARTLGLRPPFPCQAQVYIKGEGSWGRERDYSLRASEANTGRFEVRGRTEIHSEKNWRDVAQMVEGLLSMHRTLGSTPRPQKP